MTVKKIEEYGVNITERLQYEVSHTNQPQKWWKEDFPSFKEPNESLVIVEKTRNSKQKYLGSTPCIRTLQVLYGRRW